MAGDNANHMQAEGLEQSLERDLDDMITQKTDFRFEVGTESLEFKAHAIDDPVPTGRQILKSADYRPADEYLLFLWSNGVLKEVSLDETVDLRRAGIEQFIAFRSDRSFRFELANERWEWGANKIQGAVVKVLAGVDSETHELFLERDSLPDKLIEDGEFVYLSGSGIERFVIREVKSFDIIVNSRDEVVSNKRVTFEQLVALAFPDAPPPGEIIYSMTFRNVASIPHAGELAAGGSVKVKRHGSIFNVTRTVQS